MRHLKTVLTVLGAVTVLVLAGNTVVLAATGNALILGKSNSANNITAVTRTTAGSALKLTTTSSSSPLTLNGTGKVVNLNADKIDGLDSTALGGRSYVFIPKQYTGVAGVFYDLPLPSGTYLISYSNFINSADPGGIQCFINQANPTGDDVYTGYSSIVNVDGGGWDPSLTGTGLVTKKSTNQIVVGCNSDGGTFDSGGTETPFQIVATPTRVVSTKILNPEGGEPRVRQR